MVLVKLFLISIFLIAALLWVAFGYFIFNIPPKIDDQIVITNVTYTISSGALALWFTIGLVHFFLGSFFQPKVRGIDQINLYKRLLLGSLRRGFLVSAAAAGIVALNVFEVANLLNAGLIIGIVILVEIYFSSR